MAIPLEHFDAARAAGVVLWMVELGLRAGLQWKAMANKVTEERRQAHELLDMVSKEKLPAILGLLEILVEPLARSLAAAPVEEEQINQKTAAAIERANAAFERGEGIPHEEILREFGVEE